MNTLPGALPSLKQSSTGGERSGNLGDWVVKIAPTKCRYQRRWGKKPPDNDHESFTSKVLNSRKVRLLVVRTKKKEPRLRGKKGVVPLNNSCRKQSTNQTPAVYRNKGVVQGGLSGALERWGEVCDGCRNRKRKQGARKMTARTGPEAGRKKNAIGLTGSKKGTGRIDTSPMWGLNSS